MSMRELYQKVLAQPSDIQEHLGLLHGLACSSSRGVVEFGMRTGVSTIALCASGAEVHSYDIADCSAVANNIKKHGGNLTFHRQSSLDVELTREFSLMFIDSRHDYAVLKEELEKHHHKARRWIACHDTIKFGRAGQTKGDPGLLQALDEFLAAHPEWRTAVHLTNNNGLTVLSR